MCPELCSIGDTIFYDYNGNGEPGTPGVRVNLYRDDGDGEFNPGGGTDDFVGSCTTDAGGYYEFTGLDCSEKYWVEVVDATLLPGLTRTAGDDPHGPIELDDGGQGYVLADFGYQPASTPPPPPPYVGAVGGEAYPISKVGILAPWIGLAMLLIGSSITWFTLRRRRAWS